MNKEECIRAIRVICCRDETGGCMEAVYSYLKPEIDILIELIHEHFDNPPLKVEDLIQLITNDKNCECTPIWDNEYKCWRLLDSLYVTDEGVKLTFKGSSAFKFNFEENNFFRKKVEE